MKFCISLLTTLLLALNFLPAQTEFFSFIGFSVSGQSNYNYNSDLLIVKDSGLMENVCVHFDTSANVLQAFHCDSFNLRSVFKADDNGFVFTSLKKSNNNLSIIKTDSVFTIEWQKTLPDSVHLGGFSILCHDSNIYLIIKDWICKYDLTGNFLWSKRYLNFNPSYCLADFDSSILSIGSYLGDYCIIKLDSTGNLIWAKTQLNHANFNTFTPTPDSGYIFSYLYYHYLPNELELYITKYDDAGTFKWGYEYSADPDEFLGDRIITLSDGTYLVSGYNFIGGYPMTMHLNSFGAVISTQTTFPIITALREKSGGYQFMATALAGHAWYGFCQNIDTFFCSSIQTTVTKTFSPDSLIELTIVEDTGSIYLYDDSSSFIFQPWQTYLECIQTTVPETDSYSFSIYPNPSNGRINFQFPQQSNYTISICDLLGKLVYQATARNRSEFSCIPDLTAGIYSVLVTSGDHVETKKIMIY